MVSSCATVDSKMPKTRLELICVTLQYFLILSTLPHCHANTSSVEDGYVKAFGNFAYRRFWKEKRDWYIEDDEPVLRHFCSEAHKAAGKGSYPVDWLMMRERTLRFKNPKYLSRNVDVIEYTVALDGSTTPVTDTFIFWKYKLEKAEKFAITEGSRRDCVHYLNLEKVNGSQREFSLKEEVCGMPIVEESTRPPLTTAALQFQGVR